MGIHIIYPEDRIVPEDTILTRHADAIANGELPAGSHTEDALKAAQELEHIGHITLHKEQPADQSAVTVEMQAAADLLSTLMATNLKKMTKGDQADFAGINGEGYIIENSDCDCFVVFDHDPQTGNLAANIMYEDETTVLVAMQFEQIC